MRLRLSLFILCLPFISLSQSEEKAVKDGFSLLEALLVQDGERAFLYLDSSVHDKIRAEDLSLLWRQVELGLQLGKYLDTQSYLYEMPSLYIGLEFEKGLIDLKINFSPNGGVLGFFFEAPTDKTPYRIPPYADTSLFTESAYTLNSGNYRLPGKLCVPKGKGPFPIVILSHGSGPNDMDEKMGPNRVFKDIAFGLASQGIAVYRFHKRTYVYGVGSTEEGKPITVKEEYLEDLHAAIDTLSGHALLDSNRMYVMGHSLGAVLAPRVALQNTKLKGIILAAAPVQPMDSLVLYQLEYLNWLDSSGTYYRALSEYRDELDYLRSPEFSLASETNWLPLQLNAHYWMDMLQYDPVDSLMKYPGYVLILQGDDDYQVPLSEYVRWKKELAGRKRSYFSSFPDLGHGFFSSGGLKGPEQYEHYAPVSDAFIRRLVRFVNTEAR